MRSAVVPGWPVREGEGLLSSPTSERKNPFLRPKVEGICLFGLLRVNRQHRAAVQESVCRLRAHLEVEPVACSQSRKDPSEFAEELIQEAEQYNGFNLVLTDICSKSMVYVTNRPKNNKPYAFQVSPGVHVLTSASLDSHWPKAERLLQNFKGLMNTCGEGEVRANEMVQKLMRDTTKAHKSSLPGIYSLEFEYQLSSIYIEATDTPLGLYGTRSTSAVLVKANGDVCFHEWYLEDDIWKEHVITYQINKGDTQ